jgi:hypothetical protein
MAPLSSPRASVLPSSSECATSAACSSASRAKIPAWSSRGAMFNRDPRSDSSSAGNAPRVNTATSRVGTTYGDDRMPSTSTRVLSSTRARSTAAGVRLSTRACRASAADPGGVFRIPQAPATSTRSANGRRLARWWPCRRKASTWSRATRRVVVIGFSSAPESSTHAADSYSRCCPTADRHSKRLADQPEFLWRWPWTGKVL